MCPDFYLVFEAAPGGDCQGSARLKKTENSTKKRGKADMKGRKTKEQKKVDFFFQKESED